MDGWTEGWTDGWVDRPTNHRVNSRHPGAGWHQCRRVLVSPAPQLCPAPWGCPLEWGWGSDLTPVLVWLTQPGSLNPPGPHGPPALRAGFPPSSLADPWPPVPCVCGRWPRHFSLVDFLVPVCGGGPTVLSGRRGPHPSSCQDGLCVGPAWTTRPRNAQEKGDLRVGGRLTVDSAQLAWLRG